MHFAECPLTTITNALYSTDFKLALKSGLYDFTSSRDSYREASTAAGVGMHRDTILRYIELQALMLAPIAPHWAEYIWLEVLKKVSFLPPHFMLNNDLIPFSPSLFTSPSSLPCQSPLPS